MGINGSDNSESNGIESPMDFAYAMGVSQITGSITPGKRADLILTWPGWTLTKIPYTYQTPFIRQVFLDGQPQ